MLVIFLEFNCRVLRRAETYVLTPPPSPVRPIERTEPDFGSDEFEEATITFYDSANCSNATDTEMFTVADLYELYGVEESCSPSGDFDFNTVLHCSDGSPAAVYFEVSNRPFVQHSQTTFNS